MKKLLSFLFTLFILAGISIFGYFNKTFVLRQANKVRAFYYVNKGDEAYQNLDMIKAIKNYNIALKYYPEHYEAWYNLVNIYVAFEDYSLANYAYEKSFTYNPNMMMARINYGIIASEKLGNFDAAIEQYDKTIKSNRILLTIPYIFDNKISTSQNKAIAYYNRGVTYRMKALYQDNNNSKLRYKYTDKAIQSYIKSIEIEPNSYDAQFNLGTLYQISGNIEKARKCYCNAISIEPFSYEAHYNLAILLKNSRHYKQAYEEMDKAITLITALDNNNGFQEFAIKNFNKISTSMASEITNKEQLALILQTEKRELQNKLKNEIDEDDKLTVSYLKKGKIVLSDEELYSSMKTTFKQCPVIDK